MKKKIAVFLIMGIMILTSASEINAMDKRVQESGCEVIYDKNNNEDRAKGFIKSSDYHYCSVTLNSIKAGVLAKSKRKWGCGKVTKYTKWVKCPPAGPIADYARVYYGF